MFLTSLALSNHTQSTYWPVSSSKTLSICARYMSSLGSPGMA